MRKIAAILIFLSVFSSQIWACHCVLQITNAFEGLTEKVTEYINAQKNSVDRLIDEIKKNTDDVKEQNKIIEKIIEAEKKRAVQNTNIVFLMQKIIEVKTVGEY